MWGKPALQDRGLARPVVLKASSELESFGGRGRRFEECEMSFDVVVEGEEVLVGIIDLQARTSYCCPSLAYFCASERESFLP